MVGCVRCARYVDYCTAPSPGSRVSICRGRLLPHVMQGALMARAWVRTGSAHGASSKQAARSHSHPRIPSSQSVLNQCSMQCSIQFSIRFLWVSLHMRPSQ